MTRCCEAEQSAVDKVFNHDVQLLCLHTVAHLHYPQPNGIKENHFEMGEHPLEAPAVLVFGLCVNALNYRARCRLPPDDFSSKRSESTCKPGNKHQSSSLAGVESQVGENKQTSRSKLGPGALGQECSVTSEVCDLSQSPEGGKGRDTLGSRSAVFLRTASEKP